MYMYSFLHVQGYLYGAHSCNFDSIENAVGRALTVTNTNTHAHTTMCYITAHTHMTWRAYFNNIRKHAALTQTRTRKASSREML